MDIWPNYETKDKACSEIVNQYKFNISWFAKKAFWNKHYYIFFKTQLILLNIGILIFSLLDFEMLYISLSAIFITGVTAFEVLGQSQYKWKSFKNSQIALSSALNEFIIKIESSEEQELQKLAQDYSVRLADILTKNSNSFFQNQESIPKSSDSKLSPQEP